MVTKNNFPELSDEWFYVPEKHTKLKDQIKAKEIAERLGDE